MSRAIFLTGTVQAEPPVRPLQAGALSATYDGGALRWVRWHGLEVLRGLSFLVRAPGWGTPDPEISGLAITEGEDAFEVRYEARYRSGPASLSAAVRFAGSAGGTLEATVEIRPETDFETNRTGFVVLHPLEGVAGRRVEVEHASGGTASPVLPEAISPGQPLFDIAGITHFPRDGLAVSIRFGGDVFEMEDHRNWSDASFKTYSRPIGLPYPYTLEAGRTERQSVSLAVSNDAAPRAFPALDGLAPQLGSMPAASSPPSALPGISPSRGERTCCAVSRACFNGRPGSPRGRRWR